MSATQRLLTRISQSSSITTAPRRMYHERVIEHFNNPRNVGSFNAKDPQVGSAVVGSEACGDILKIQLKVNEETGVVDDVCFKTYGCGSAIASSSVATEMVKGKTLDECLEIKNTVIAKYLSLPPVKLHCSMLAEEAIHAAVKDYKKKRASRETTEAASQNV
eukprot:TRINITY_DN71_c0_g1_i1.p2 TRINITY_DN71_c0_g1~~TRINITY_DN71_c0_g1_i1.p2  ORF type:complete len:162 (+),score=69.06 TRINITY_DN71_c0_g1_i1:44-529(+)